MLFAILPRSLDEVTHQIIGGEWGWFATFPIPIGIIDDLVGVDF